MKKWSEVYHRWTYPVEVYSYPMAEVDVIHILEKDDQTRAFIIICRYLGGSCSIGIVELSAQDFDTRIHNFCEISHPLDKHHTSAALLKGNKILILTQTFIYGYDTLSYTWDAPFRTTCPLKGKLCQFHVAVANCTQVDDLPTHIHHQSTYGQAVLLFSQHNQFPAWVSAVPIQPEVPIILLPSQLIRLDDADIRGRLKLIAKMSNISDQLLEDNTAEMMSADECLFLSSVGT